MKLEPSGHLDQLMRQTRAHHVSLSAMADAKANMLITVSGLIVPLTLSVMSDPVLRIPALTMVTFAVLTIVLAAYAVMPKLGRVGRRRPGDHLFNPLFFGDFVGLNYEEYLQQMQAALEEPGAAYESMVREVYVLGQYLARRKYRYLSFAYLAFIVGVVVSSLLGIGLVSMQWSGVLIWY